MLVVDGERQGGTDDVVAVDADDEVEPGLDGEGWVGVAQDLETVGCEVGVRGGGFGRGIGVEARDEAVEGGEHGLGRR